MNPDDATKQSLSSLISEVNYIQLHLPSQNYIRRVQKILFKNSFIYILEAAREGSKPKIYCFNQQGQFKFVIDRPGRGPGEYEYIYDFIVTESAVVISTLVELMYYDIENGNFLKSIELLKNSFVQTISMLNDSILVYAADRTRYNISKNLIKFYNIESGKYIQETIPFENHSLKTGHSYRYFFYSEDTLSVLPMYEQTVYRIIPKAKNHTLEPAYQFNFGEHWIPDDLLDDSYDNRENFFR